MSKKTKAAMQVKPQKDSSENKTQNKQSLIYLGPSIPGVVRHANVFSSGILPNALQKAVSETPAMCRLIVPVSESAALVKELKKQSAAANIYTAVAEKYLTK